jgi:UDP-N-acetylglucosamine--N-acetylmuramyl-(pentapeptide) pyrophosphoryl-undecaprenol N-acetylglucosamine transferase
MTASASSTFAVITGGGTSGHVVPAIAIAELLVDQGCLASQIYYVGSTRGVESTMVPALGIGYSLLKVDGLQRGISPRMIRRNIAMVFTLLKANREAKQLLASLQPHVVISVGGYASIPACRAARALNIPVVACSYDRRPGLATKMQSRYAFASAVAYEGSSLPRAIVTGAPVRRVLRTAQLAELRDAARTQLGIGLGDRVVLVMGGSLGSAVLNAATEHLVKSLHGSQHTCVVHIAGERYMHQIQLPEQVQHDNGNLAYLRLAYSADMVGMYAAADVVVCRAGASTIAEIATVGVCSVVVPWKDAAENHQLVNARWLTDHDAALLMEESALTHHDFAAVIESLLIDDDRRMRIARNAKALGIAHRESKIVDVINDAARSGKLQ